MQSISVQHQHGMSCKTEGVHRKSLAFTIEMLTVNPEDPINEDASQLIEELSSALASITGDDGT